MPSEGRGELALVHIPCSICDLDHREPRAGKQLCRIEHPLMRDIAGDTLAEHAVKIVLDAALADGEQLRELAHGVLL